MTCSELLHLGFFGEAAPSSGEGSDLCPLGDAHFPVLGFTFCPKMTETSVSELRTSPVPVAGVGHFVLFLCSRAGAAAQGRILGTGRASLAASMAPKSFILAQESHPAMIHGCSMALARVLSHPSMEQLLCSIN